MERRPMHHTYIVQTPAIPWQTQVAGVIISSRNPAPPESSSCLGPPGPVLVLFRLEIYASETRISKVCEWHGGPSGLISTLY